MVKKIAVVTGTRADYGLLYWLLRELQDDPEVDLQLIATGMHLSPEFGETYKVIESDGFDISERIEMLLSSDTVVGMIKSVGMATIGFADSFARLQPDVVVLLGDRFEMLAAAQAALMSKISIAHIHGGELSEGVIDEAIRHAITKMAHYHFVAAESYRKRVIQLGEQPDRVFNVGALGLDYIRRTELMSRADLERDLQWQFGAPTVLVTYHPVTLAGERPEEAAQELLCALEQFRDAKVLMTMPNADAGGRSVHSLLQQYAVRNSQRVYFTSSLGQRRYLSAIQTVDVVVGNSSSGIIEAPPLGTPTVNIGVRQNGRLRADSIIDCEGTCSDIADAIRRALTPEFKRVAARKMTPYGDGESAVSIKEHLKLIPLGGVSAKRFFDLPMEAFMKL